MAKEKWIAGATKNKGALHRALGVPEGEKIPAKKMAKAAKSKNPKIKKALNELEDKCKFLKVLGSYPMTE